MPSNGSSNVIHLESAARNPTARVSGSARIPEFWSGADRPAGAHDTSCVRIRVVTERSEFELVEVRRR